MAQIYDEGKIDSILISYFEEKVDILSQKLANDMKKALKINFKIGEESEITKSYYPENPNNTKSDSSKHQTSLLINTLENFLKMARKDQYFTLLNKLLEIPEGQTDKDSTMELCYSILVMLLTYINSQKLTEKIAQHISLYHLTQADEYRSLSETTEYIGNLSEVIFEAIKDQEKLRTGKIIDMLIKFITENLHEDLSLARLSEEVHYNPTYLSRLFKQESGVNLSSFILNARIDKAKELLIDGKYKINKIAKKVGYESAHSFTRTFKNITGVSPLDYRNDKL